MPYSYRMILIGSLSLIGFPFLTGFYSKDLLLELRYFKFRNLGVFLTNINLVGAFLTSCYSFRLLFSVFLRKPKGYKKVFEKAHEPDKNMRIPLLFLSLFSIIFGFLRKELIVGISTSIWNNAIFIPSERTVLLITEFNLSIALKLLPLIFVLIG